MHFLAALYLVYVFFCDDVLGKYVRQPFIDDY